MSSDPLPLCPACGTPAAPDAAFCDACGAALHAEGAEPGPAVPGPAVPGPAVPGPVVETHAENAESAESAAPAAPGPAVPPPAADDVPFELEWDEARGFIEKRAGQFAFRFRALCDFAKAAVAATVNGQDGGLEIFTAMQRGESRECLIAFTPDFPGTLSVKLRVETILAGGMHETFEAARAIEHVVYPATLQEVQGGGNVTVNYAPKVENNTGIVRLDDTRISVAGQQTFLVNHMADQDSVLGRRGLFKPVSFTPIATRRENARFRAIGAVLDELLVIPGSDLIGFGRSGSRADVRLLPETPEGLVDDTRANYVSGVHFTIRRDRAREEFLLCDGGPGAKSTNGLAFCGQSLRAARTLPPDETLPVVLAPYAVAGGALPLEFETRGWDDPAAAGCTDRPGNLSSLLVRRRDNPRKAVLVVWGGAALDPILGTKTGLRVAARSRQLRLEKPGGPSRRLVRLAGGRLGDTAYEIR